MRLEPMSQPTNDSFSDHLQAFYERVYREIKLYSGAERIQKFVLKFKSMTTFSIKVLKGFRPKNVRGIN